MLSSKGGTILNYNLSLYYDLFFSSVGLLCGGILIFQGWRLDPILLLCQILSSGTAMFFIGESIWLRNANLKKNNLLKKINNDEKNIYLNNSLQTSKNQDGIFTTFYYQDIKISFNKQNFCWQTVNYTLPIDYGK